MPRERVHLHQGGTRQLLVTFPDQLRADVVVMGAVSRTGLERMFIGSPAEAVLAKLSCDVLIVKPAGLLLRSEQASRELQVRVGSNAR
jgi:universal stress protein E